MLESAVYARFAAQNTVEVVVTEEMDRALREQSPLIETYRDRDPYGDEVDYLVKFPGVTLEQLRGLSNSKAVNYISSSNRIPYTAIVDPHTGKELEGFTGVHPVKHFIATIKKRRKELTLKHGKGISRKVWNNVSAYEIQVDLLLGRDKLVEAWGAYEALTRETFSEPAGIRNRVAAILDTILADAEKRLRKLEDKLAITKNRKLLRKEAMRIARVVKDTPLQERAEALLEKLK